MARKLLLADDSITIQKVVELILSEEDFTITSVGNGQEAVDRLSEDIPDVILADIEMPELDGYDLCRHVKNDPRTSHIPVILLAGAFESFDTTRAREVGAADHVIKPFEAAELIGKINAVISQTEQVAASPVVEDVLEATVEETDAAAVADDEEVAAVVVDESDDLWSTEEIPEVGEEGIEWEDALDTATDSTAVEVQEAVEEDTALDDEIVSVTTEDAESAENAATEEVVAAEEIEVEETLLAEEDRPDSPEPAPAASVVEPVRIEISPDDIREEVRSAVSTAVREALPPVDIFSAAVREAVSAAISVPDPGPMIDEAARAAMPAEETVTGQVREAVDASVRGALDSEQIRDIIGSIVREEIQATLQATVKDAFEKTLWEVLPETVERVGREILEQAVPGAFRTALDEVARKTVPDVAERIITEEIERIKSENR